MPAALLDIEHVSKRFVKHLNLGERIAGLLGAGPKAETVRAVTNVSLTVAKGEVVGLVGESGCGKSTLGRMIAGIYTPSDGKILFDKVPVARPQGRRTQKLTTRVQMIHQDPFASLNPRIRIGERAFSLAEAIAYLSGQIELRGGGVGLDEGSAFTLTLARAAA